MIFTERTITIRNDSASINTPVILYRGDKNVEVRFTLVESPYKYSNRDSVNIIESTDAAYAQLIIKTPNDRDPIFGDITAVGQSNIIFVIEYDMIDEIGEVGEYDFQIRLFDSDQTSMVTLPEVVSGFIIKEPIAKEDTTNNITNSAIVGSAVVTSDVSIPTFVGGSYNKTAWDNGTVISRQKLDKIEDGIYETYELSKVNNSQIKEKANKNELDIERKRIDSLTKLEEGSTTGDAELIDARIGANSIIYDNAGNAIREQINDINNIVSQIGSNKLININFTKISNSYIAPTTGGFVPYDGWSRTDYTDCRNYSKLIINNVNHSSTYNCFYDNNKKYLPNSGFSLIEGQNIISVPVGASYFIISNNDESMNAITINALKYEEGTLEKRIFNLENSIGTVTGSETNKLKIMTYNFGLFNDGVSYVDDKKIDEFAIKFRKLFGKQDADIVHGQEFMHYFNVSQNIETTSLITDFKYKNNTKDLTYGSLIFSKKSLVNSIKVDFAQGNRSYIKSFITVDGKEICLINAHTSSEVDFNTNRKAQFQELITEMNKHNYVILTGDFNAFSKSEFDIFKSSGYKLCNGGDFGWFETWYNCGRDNNGWTNAAIDNIIVSSNISIQNVEMIEGQPSDHAPLIAELIIN